MQATDEAVRSFGIGRVFKETHERINAIDFHRRTDLLVTSGDDDAIRLYNMHSGVMEKTSYSRKYGAAHVCFTHHEAAVIYASSKGTDHSLRYLAIHDNRYLRYFQGHTARVTTLCMSPRSDMFISAAQDNTLRLWDLRTTVCQGLLTGVDGPGGQGLATQPCAAIDAQGQVFAVGLHSGVIKLYDPKNYTSGPFHTFMVPAEANNPTPFGMVRFSPDQTMLAAVVEGRIHVLDGFHGPHLFTLDTGVPPGGTALEMCFSPDSQYLLSGCEDCLIRAWRVKTGGRTATSRDECGYCYSDVDPAERAAWGNQACARI
ncbi:hypothetical protein WJX81_005062 [Elliptochloris bilobata]|uniref:Uncharacterized protein n=1 Tax=Elliptochloris bilobata TaxID=381761 RepID=A0AAW1RXJ7_9CHLO